MNVYVCSVYVRVRVVRLAHALAPTACTRKQREAHGQRSQRDTPWTHMELLFAKQANPTPSTHLLLDICLVIWMVQFASPWPDTETGITCDMADDAAPMSSPKVTSVTRAEAMAEYTVLPGGKV